MRPAPECPLVLTAGGDSPRIVAALDVPRQTSVDALVAPVLRVRGGAILTRGPLPEPLRPAGWRSVELSGASELPTSVHTVLSAGSLRAVSLPVHEVAKRRGMRFAVVQHGLLTPYAMPLPEGATLLAWSDVDGEFWTSGREDLATETVGAQLLWQAARQPARGATDGRPLWLGQLHGTELPRRQFVDAAERFWRLTGAEYRPHPAERGIRERLQHRRWRAKGMVFDESGRSLAALDRPVAAIFSTGILEASVRGLPAWAFHPDPPAWVSELWERYGIAPYGRGETHVAAPAEEPALAIARWLG